MKQEAAWMLFRKELSEEVTLSQSFACSETVSCVTLSWGESVVGEGNASAKVLRQKLLGRSTLGINSEVGASGSDEESGIDSEHVSLFPRDICSGSSVSLIRPWNVDRGLQLTAQAHVLSVAGCSCTGWAPHKYPANHEDAFHICILNKMVLTRVRKGAEEVSFANLHKTARQFISSGSGDAILKKGEKSECERV